MKFTKMQGCGNDYIYIDCFREKVSDPSGLAIRLSDRHFGIGSDGLILIEPTEKADAYMHMFNKDGSEGKMCGNGIRCTAKYIYDHGLIPRDREKAMIDTAAGVREITLYKKDGKVVSAKVDMGRVTCDAYNEETVIAAGKELRFIRADVGNPHAVFFLENNPLICIGENPGPGAVESIPIEEIGPEIECSSIFPDRVNAEFAEIINRKEIRVRVWERGSGETMACGTGAVAAAAAGYFSGKLDSEVTVHLNGGDLNISFDRKTNHWYMTGMAEEVFEGTI